MAQKKIADFKPSETRNPVTGQPYESLNEAAVELADALLDG